MRKLVILAMIAFVSFNAIANDPVEDFRSHKVNKTEVVNVSPFCISVAKGDYDMVKKMIELGEDVNAFSNQMTPLMFAARYNQTEIIKLLIANGANIGQKNGKGFTAIQYAEFSNAQQAKNLLVNTKKNK